MKANNIKTIGHKKVLDYFTILLDKKRIHHAYCFVGSKHVGKRHVALEIAKKLLLVDDVFVSSDFIEIKREKNNKTNKTKKDISIDQIKRLRNFLSMTSASGGYKVAIISSAERMNIAASNALLKTLEEPTKNTVIILTVENDDILLPTILSRVHRVRFLPVDRQELQENLRPGYSKEKLFNNIMGWSRGLPGLAIRLLENQEERDEYLQEIERFNNFINKPFSDKLKAVNSMFGDKSDHIKQRQYIMFVLNIWQKIIRDIWETKLGKEPVFNITADVSAFDDTLIVTLLKTIDVTKIQLKKNIHPRLSVEQILLLIP